MSVQYKSSGGANATSKADLTGSVPAHGHYLVRGSGTGDPDLTPDATGGFSASGSSGLLMLVDGTTLLTPVPAGTTTGNVAIIDAIGYGSANAYETTPAGGVAVNQSLTRTPTGRDTDVNEADFSAAAPDLVGTTEPGEPDPEPEPEPHTIPEIQGTGPVSPLDGAEVVTEGVVTAAYPSGLFGFYLQTPGSGGALDLGAHRASDGVFVYHPFGSGAVSVEPGDHVEVTGEVDEYAGLTQLRIADAATDVVALDTPAAAPSPVTGVWPDTDAEREALEGMLFVADGEFTVSDTYSTNSYGEVGLARGTSPLITPTEVADAQDPTAIAAVEADNAARAIVLDDASSTNYTSSSSYTPTKGDLTPPYVSNSEPVRVGAAATFDAPVVYSQGGSPSSPTYRFQPTQTVLGPGNATSPVGFENTRTSAPDEALINEEGVADVKVASFNVLNYFTTLGDPDDDNVGNAGCLAYNDRDGDGNNVRTGCGSRGAWDPQDLARQQEKIVAAINALDADVVGLMEIESSAVVDGVANADEATETLVAALNGAAGSTVWAANPSSADLPDVSQMDVISNAIIYRVDAVERVGAARALGDQSGGDQAFGNAREPIAQAFAPVDGGESVLVVVNHFKSKGSGTDDGTGQGNANPDRIAQAEALRDWVPSVQQDLGVDATLLLGDFNSYTMEDPLQVLYAAGYTDVERASGHDEYSYSFAGQSGSLDHILANEAAMASYTGVDVWNINSPESVALEYSRWNIHSTDFHTATPYRSSDHDPVIMGLDLADGDEGPEPVGSTLRVKATPDKVTENKTRVKLQLHVKAHGEKPTGTVQLGVQDQGSFTGELHHGKFTLRLDEFETAGTKTVEVTYSGDDAVAGGTRTITIEVHPAKQKKAKQGERR